MGVLSLFLRKITKSGYHGGVDEELDVIRSEYPRTLASGFHNWGATSTTQNSILVVPSGKVLHLRNVMINNRDGVPQMAFFYDGPGTTVSVGGIQVNTSTTELIGKDLLRGFIFQSAVHASLATSLTGIRVGGLIRDSD